jgi:hypothetical protein
MELLLGTCLVYLLYIRTLNYNYVIDDNVKRNGYLYDVPDHVPSNAFYVTRPSKKYRFFMISMHAVNALLVSMLWGWKAGLLYAAHPIGVTAAVWVTGNYYATTTYFVLIGMFFLKLGGLFGVISSMLFYWTACYSTITAVGVPFVFLFANPWGLLWLAPLAQFFTGRRWKTGIKIRKNAPSTKGQKWTIRTIGRVPRILIFYMALSFFPTTLGFFREYGNGYYRTWDDGYDKFDLKFWICSLLLVVSLALGLSIDVFATMLFVCSILPFIQLKIYGQFVAERYAQIPIIGACILLSYSNPYVYTALLTYFVVRTFLYTTAFRNIEELFKNDIVNFPEHSLAYSNLASNYLEDGGDAINTAYTLLKKAELIEKKKGHHSYEVAANLALAHIYRRQGNHALSYTERALELGGDKILEKMRKALTIQRDN